ncbi:hypothetical protein BS47DRAFT_1290778 [Hydnum rufescens UP504]|uniref:Uncharacterized protein n=1 Tax=Hydnum rufescens UP504 TaxID=1448309 RepID=A0A9P6B4Y3_9AGAM|nr:hypothetical protein BS47DRAFT_1290778 [Hydnum rufescens UP504]
MPRIPYIFPEPGEDPVADRIRQRRGPRGLSSLDGTLLNAPNIADSWNTFIGTLRNNNSLPSDIRELLILRIAALNGAAFEWIQHEHIGRAAGLTTAHLFRIGDVSNIISTAPPLDPLTSLQRAALAFVDASTRLIRVPDEIFTTLKAELESSLKTHNPDNVTVERQIVEATTTVGAYNLVSRFLVALDVDDRASQHVPVPTTPHALYQHYSIDIDRSVTLHAKVRFHPTNPKAPALLFINSILTNISLWSSVLPALTTTYTLITFDQRGHGGSSSPRTDSTIPRLAQDVACILDYLQIKQAHGVIGVSQGGATALSFAVQYPTRLRRLVVCDTQAASPVDNRAAWAERIALAVRDENGMDTLAELTTARWFPTPGSPFIKGGKHFPILRDMIVGTPVQGFVRSAPALQSYDLRADGLIQTLKAESRKEDGMRILLLAGELDGKLPAGLKALRDEIGGDHVEFQEIQGSGHLPMLDQPERWLGVVEPFLRS